ncbi:MAG: hypothetical protein LUQ31_07795 [Methanoregula sp.]|nr:hypothetical protein [Methanoregula sp.]
MKNTTTAVCLGIVFMLILVLFTAGCTTTSVMSGGITGTYVNSKNTDDSIELSSDGTFYCMTDKSNGYRGKWELSGDTVRLNTDMLGITIQLKYTNNTLVLSNKYGPDTVYVKQ